MKALDRKEAIHIAVSLWSNKAILETLFDKQLFVHDMQPNEIRAYMKTTMMPTEQNANELVAMFAVELTRPANPREEVLQDIIDAHSSLRMYLQTQSAYDSLPSLAVYLDKQKKRL